jgi:hypothetical protein
MLSRLEKKLRRESRIKALETAAIVVMIGGVAILIMTLSILNALAIRGVRFF